MKESGSVLSDRYCQTEQRSSREVLWTWRVNAQVRDSVREASATRWLYDLDLRSKARIASGSSLRYTFE